MKSARLLLDEMLSSAIAAQLGQRGHDVEAVVVDPDRRRLPDEEILSLATDLGRTVVTTDIRDFALLDRVWTAVGRRHAGLVFLPSAAFPQTAGFIGAVVTALHAAATAGTLPLAGGVVFLAGPTEVDES